MSAADPPFSGELERASLAPHTPYPTALDEQLEVTWRDKPGVWGWLCAVDHKEIGKRYIVTAVIMLILGGVLAVAMRLQLARPESGLIGPDRYN